MGLKQWGKLFFFLKTRLLSRNLITNLLPLCNSKFFVFQFVAQISDFLLTFLFVLIFFCKFSAALVGALLCNLRMTFINVILANLRLRNTINFLLCWLLLDRRSQLGWGYFSDWNRLYCLNWYGFFREIWFESTASSPSWVLLSISLKLILSVAKDHVYRYFVSVPLILMRIFVKVWKILRITKQRL